MKITFYGAAKEVTGSCYLLETEQTRIIIDCGLHQGSHICEQDNYDPFPFDASTVDAVVLSHAHLDHCGRVPKLVREGFSGPIISTAPTLALAYLIMEDSTRILGREAAEEGIEPIYNEDDVQQAQSQFEALDYYEQRTLNDVTIELFDAGHILGSTIIRITDSNGKAIVFSGDLGNPPVPLLNPTDRIPDADFVVMESTYGGRIHEDKKDRQLLLKSAIYETVTMGGTLMIPAFAMERTQEILFELNEMVNNKDIPEVPIFLDSPLAIKATRVFQQYSDYFNQETQSIINSGDDVFQFPGLKMTLTTDESKAINAYPAPKVIIAGSGMAQGGRIVHHIRRYIEDEKSQYLIVGYQVNGSLGRRILNGEKTIRVNGEELEVRAKVRAIGGYSAHADRAKLTSWVTGMKGKKPTTIFLTHGEEDQAKALKHHLQQSMDTDIQIPGLNDSIELI